MNREFEIIYSKNGTFQRVDLKEYNTLEEEEVLVRPLCVAVCGSDLHIMENSDFQYLRLGHEWVGRVDSIGSRVNIFKPGDLVTTTASLGCGKCSNCLEGYTNFCALSTKLSSTSLGALRSYLNINQSNLLKVPPVDPVAATLFEVAGVGFEAMRMLESEVSEVGNLAIFGCGPVGIMSALVAKKKGLEPYLVDCLPSRVKKAREFDLKALSSQHLIMDHKYTNYFNTIIDATGNNSGSKGILPSLHLYAAPRFTGVIVGKYHNSVSIQSDFFAKLGAKLLWMCGMGTDSLKDAIDYFQGEIQEICPKFVTHIFSPENVDDAFKMAKHRDGVLKVIIKMDDF